MSKSGVIVLVVILCLGGIVLLSLIWICFLKYSDQEDAKLATPVIEPTKTKEKITKLAATNKLTSENYDRIKIGMTHKQVINILGNGDNLSAIQTCSDSTLQHGIVVQGGVGDFWRYNAELGGKYEIVIEIKFWNGNVCYKRCHKSLESQIERDRLDALH